MKYPKLQIAHMTSHIQYYTLNITHCMKLHSFCIDHNRALCFTKWLPSSITHHSYHIQHPSSQITHHISQLINETTNIPRHTTIIIHHQNGQVKMDDRPVMVWVSYLVYQNIVVKCNEAQCNAWHWNVMQGVAVKCCNVHCCAMF